MIVQYGTGALGTYVVLYPGEVVISSSIAGPANVILHRSASRSHAAFELIPGQVPVLSGLYNFIMDPELKEALVTCWPEIIAWHT